MKLSTAIFAITAASLLSGSIALADDVGRDQIYGSNNTAIDFSSLPATAAGQVRSGKVGVQAIPDYLEGVNSNQ